jgi:hypothetical protein
MWWMCWVSITAGTACVGSQQMVWGSSMWYVGMGDLTEVVVARDVLYPGSWNGVPWDAFGLL